MFGFLLVLVLGVADLVAFDVAGGFGRMLVLLLVSVNAPGIFLIGLDVLRVLVGTLS